MEFIISFTKIKKRQLIMFLKKDFKLKKPKDSKDIFYLKTKV